MKGDQLSTLSVKQLLDRFVQLGLEQSEAADVVNTSRYNRIVMLLVEVGSELKSRPGDQRSALAVLLNHSNLQLRFTAATHLMAIMPDEARRHIEQIAESRYDPTAGIAGTYLLKLDIRSEQA